MNDNHITLDMSNECEIVIINNNRTTHFKNVKSLSLSFDSRKCLFIRPVHNKTTLNDIGSLFERYGPCDIVLKYGYGFITYDDERDARDALELDGKLFNNSRLSVSFYRNSKYVNMCEPASKNLNFQKEETFKPSKFGHFPSKEEMFNQHQREECLRSLSSDSFRKFLTLRDMKYEKGKMYLYNLPKDTELSEIFNLCNRFGNILECKELFVKEMRNNCYSILYENDKTSSDAIKYLNETKFGGNFMFAQKEF